MTRVTLKSLITVLLVLIAASLIYWRIDNRRARKRERLGSESPEYHKLMEPTP